MSDIVGVPVLGFHQCKNPEQIQERTLHMIARALTTGRLIAFIGSGISRAYGYDKWEGLVEKLVRHTLVAADSKMGQSTRKLLDDFIEEQEQARRAGRAIVTPTYSPLNRADRLLLLLNLCDIAIRRVDKTLQEEIERVVKKVRQDKPKEWRPPKDKDPLLAIVRSLRIKRFLTTNYDLEIEETLKSEFGKEIPPMGVGEDFMGVERLMKLAVAAPQYETGVFHCHGSIERPDSMVVTERNYQRMYLQSAPSSKSFRDALNLVFAANPVLFMGVGMGEPDLLRTLRQFVSERSEQTRESPLFALLPGEPDSSRCIEFRKYLYIRFGVKACFYSDKGDHTAALVKSVRQIADNCFNWWLDWQEKPVMRLPNFPMLPGKPERMLHHKTISKSLMSETKPDKKVRRAVKKNKAVMVLGRPGTGKGSLGVKLVENAPGTYSQCFFATMHFTNEFLSMLDAAADFFLGSKKAKNKEPIARFKHILNCNPPGRKWLIVIGGIERMLIPAEPGQGQRKPVAGYRHPMPLGKPVTPEVERFLRICNGHSGNAHLVLTSSLQPVGLEQPKVVRLSGLPVDQRGDLFPGVDAGVVNGLSYLLRGHAYALAVAHEAVREMSSAEASRWLQYLRSRLTAVDLSRRAELTIRFVIDWLRSRDPAHGAALLEVLQRVSMFTTPVRLPSIAACLKREAGTDLEELLRELEQRRLLLRIWDSDVADDEPAANRYTAHTVVRRYVLHTMGHLPDTPAEPHRFELGCFSSESDESQTGARKSYENVTAGIDLLLDELEKESGGGAPDRELLRAAYGLIRSHWPATSIGRLRPVSRASDQLPLYDDYFKRLARFVNLLRRGDKWVVETDSNLDVNGALYADENAWLFNQLGLVVYCQGHMPDSYGFFRLGQDVNIAAERGNHGHRWTQSEINLACVKIDRADLAGARFHLDNAYRSSQRLNDTALNAQATGFLGLLDHLDGDFEAADERYKTAIKTLCDLRIRRGESIFRRHRADLLRFRDDRKAAAIEIRQCIASAESGRHMDLLHYARIALANLELRNGDHAHAQHVLEDALQFARWVGIPKLEADACKIKGHLALHHGETEAANRLAIKCLGLAAANDMRLRLTSALVFMGRVARVRGDRRVARSILDTAIAMGGRQSYTLQVELAERERMEMRYAETPAD